MFGPYIVLITIIELYLQSHSDSNSLGKIHVNNYDGIYDSIYDGLNTAFIINSFCCFDF